MLGTNERLVKPSFLIPRVATESSQAAAQRVPTPSYTAPPPFPYAHFQSPMTTLPHMFQRPAYDPDTFENRRHIHERINDTMFQYQMLDHIASLRIGDEFTGPQSTSYHGPGNYPGGIFTDYSVDSASWSPNYGRTYGGAGRQWLYQSASGAVGVETSWFGESGAGPSQRARRATTTARRRRWMSSGRHATTSPDDCSFRGALLVHIQVVFCFLSLFVSHFQFVFVLCF